MLTNLNPLKNALDEVLIVELGYSDRDTLWQDLWKNYGITLDDLTTLEKMQNTLQLVIGDRAKSLVKAAFARYIKEKRIMTRDSAETSSNDASNLHSVYD